MTVHTNLKVLTIRDRNDPMLASEYAAQGVVAVRDVLTPDEVDDLGRNVERYRRWILPAVPDSWSRREPDGTVRGMYFVDRADPWFAEFGARQDLRDLIEGITGLRAEFEGLETFDKPAKVGSPALPHQDGVYFADTPTRLVHIWLPLDEALRSNGALQYWTGTHHQGLQPHVPTDDPHLLEIEQGVLSTLPAPHAAELQPGSAAIHTDRIVHASPANTSDRSRRAVVLAWRVHERTD